MEKRSLTIGIWVIAGLLGFIAYSSWQQLAILNADASPIPVVIETTDGQPLAVRTTSSIQVDIADVSLNDGRFGDISGGYLPMAPVQIADTGRFAAYPVTVENNQLAVSVNGRVDVTNSFSNPLYVEFP